jgi:hypothetical protein
VQGLRERLIRGPLEYAALWKVANRLSARTVEFAAICARPRPFNIMSPRSASSPPQPPDDVNALLDRRIDLDQYGQMIVEGKPHGTPGRQRAGAPG